MSSLYRLAVLTALKTLKLWLRRLFGFHLASRQWGKTANSVVVWPISFTNTDYTATALKNSDHGGGIPNIIGLDKNKITIEFESMSYGNGIGTQNTYIANGVHVIAVGK
nr:MAG TPA: hypothetical protein [Caudoviricetes sp.]